MTESRKSNREQVLDRRTLELLGSAPRRADVTSQRTSALRNRVMRRIDEETAGVAPFTTIRADDGAWVEIAPLAEKRLLNVDPDAGTESYLLRLHPGVALAQHRHGEDELCIVLEGDVSFDDIKLAAGDYHFARKGSVHGVASTVHGALLFLQSGAGSAQPVV